LPFIKALKGLAAVVGVRVARLVEISPRFERRVGSGKGSHKKGGTNTAYGDGADVAGMHPNIGVREGTFLLDLLGGSAGEYAVELGWKSETANLNGVSGLVDNGESQADISILDSEPLSCYVQG